VGFGRGVHAADDPAHVFRTRPSPLGGFTLLRLGLKPRLDGRTRRAISIPILD
jgi:hypothetical protein